MKQKRRIENSRSENFRPSNQYSVINSHFKSGFSLAQLGITLDKFGIVLDQFGVVGDNFGAVWDTFGNKNTPQNSVFVTKTKKTQEMGVYSRLKHSAIKKAGIESTGLAETHSNF